MTFTWCLHNLLVKSKPSETCNKRNKAECTLLILLIQIRHSHREVGLWCQSQQKRFSEPLNLIYKGKRTTHLHLQLATLKYLLTHLSWSYRGMLTQLNLNSSLSLSKVSNFKLHISRICSSRVIIILLSALQ